MVPADRSAERETGMRLYAVATEADVIEATLDVEIDGHPAILILDRHSRVTERAGRPWWIPGLHRVRIELFDSASLVTQETGIGAISRLSPADESEILASIAWIGVKALIRQIVASRAHNFSIFQWSRMSLGNHHLIGGQA